MEDTTAIAAESFLTEQTEVEAILSAAGVLGVELKLVNGTVTATGKVKVNKSRRRHILEKKSTKMKRQLRKGGLAAASDVPRIRRMCPYK